MSLEERAAEVARLCKEYPSSVEGTLYEELAKLIADQQERLKELEGFLKRLVEVNLNCDSESEASGDLTVLALEAKQKLKQTLNDIKKQSGKV